MYCDQCKTRKLRREFPLDTITEKCDHAPLHCLRVSVVSFRAPIKTLIIYTLAKLRRKSDHVYFVHPSTDISVEISVDISTDTRPMYRSTYRPICRSTYRPMYQPRYQPSDGRHIDRLSADISVDIADCRRNIGRPSVVYRSKA